MIFGKDSFQIAAWLLFLRQANRRAVSILALNGKEIRITLGKSEEACFDVMLPRQNAERRLRSGIIRGAPIPGPHGLIEWPANKVRPIEVIERRNSQQGLGVEGMYPGKICEPIGLTLHVANACVLRVAIVRYLKEISSRPGNQTQLVFWVQIENQRGKAAQTVGLVVEHQNGRRLQAVITATKIYAAVISEAFRVAAEAQLIVRLVKISICQQQLTLAFSLETAARDYIQDRVSAIAEFRRITATLNFEIVDVLRIKLRADRVRDVRVRHRHAIDEPSHLMPAANVQLIVGQIRTGNEVSYECETVSAIRSGSLRDFLPGN